MKQFTLIFLLLIICVYNSKLATIENDFVTKINTNTIGYQIKTQRLKQQLTTEQMSDFLKVPVSTIKKIENNEVMPTRFLLMDIQSVLQTEILMDDYVMK